MGSHLDSVPLSGLIRIRDLMYSVNNPYRLDQGELSFEAPEAIKDALTRAIAANHTHYVQTNGVPQLRELLTERLRTRASIPVETSDEVLITAGGMHGLYLISHALLDPGDEILVPDPVWPSTTAHILTTQAVPIGCPLHESLRWRYDLDELESKITPRTRAIFLNSPHNPTGGVLTRKDLGHITDLARERNLWIISDEAYEDIVYDGAEHVSPASLPDMYPRTIPVYTFSKSYAITGLRLGYLAVKDPTIRERVSKLLSFTASNVSSIIQYGGIGGLKEPQEWIPRFRQELQTRRDIFYKGIESLDGLLTGSPPQGTFYAFLKIDPSWHPPTTNSVSYTSRSWMFAEYLIQHGRVGCIPGADFGSRGEGYIRFCFSREQSELLGALEAIKKLTAIRDTNMSSLAR